MHFNEEFQGVRINESKCQKVFRNKYTYELKINFMLDTKDFN